MNSCIHAPLMMIILLLQVCRVAIGCQEAVKSVVKVESCPTNNQEWENAAKLKNCNKLTAQQQCTDADKFVYHCLINGFVNETLEVCAPKLLIYGYCAGFNITAGVIQSYSAVPCNEDSFPKCKEPYQSSEAYKYQGCYEIVYKKKSSTSEKPINKYDFTGLALVIALTFLVCVTAIPIAIHLCRGCKASRHQNRREESLISFQSRGDNDNEGPEEPFISVQKTGDNNLERNPLLTKDSDVSTGTDKFTMVSLMSDEDYRQENKEDSERFLKHFQKMNKYFVETRTYKKAKDTFDRCNVVILTGPPGCGKTLAAVHLIGEKPSSCTFRKIRSWEELSYIEKDENSIILIDNIFSREPKDLENWWKILDKYNEYELQDSSRKSTSPRVRILITARPNVIETACSYMDRVTPILNENSRINISELTEDEKHKILEKQIEFATKEKGYQDPKINAKFKREVATSDGPIGFPLCAHLYACCKEYRKSGAIFFSYPIEYLKLQIKDEIESDNSNRVKTLFFCLFFHKWHTKMENSESFQIQNEHLCKRSLEKICSKILEHFGPFNFRDLRKEAQRLSGTFFELVGGEHTCKFLHDSIYEAVEGYFCDCYVTESIKYFPLDIIHHQDYKYITEMQMSTLATRLLYETLDQQLSYVFSCRVFRIRKFTDRFCSELKKMSERTINNIFTIANNSSTVMLPCIFWSSFNDFTYLTERFFEIVKEKNVNPDYQLYVSLYGMCCARSEGVLKTINGVLLNNSEMIKNRVHVFQDQWGNCILHYLVKSHFSDEFVSFAVRKLLSDGMSVDLKNQRKITSLMFAVQQVIPRSKVIEILLEFNPRLQIKDAGDSNVFHHCLGSSIDDKTCARYLEIISRNNNNVEKCLEQNDVKGNTALSIAAMFSKPSRIRSILFLLKSNAKTINILNDDGYSPLHLSVRELRDKKSSVELECCVRVVIFILYGAKLDLESDERKQAVQDCHFDLVKTVLRNPQDKTNMEQTLVTILEKTNCNKCKMISEEELMESMKLIPSEKINTGILKCFANAVKHLEH